ESRGLGDLYKRHGRGVSFVLDAPAGTDRDAVIASIIANASAKGRRVRYIASDEETKEGVRRCLESISPDNHDYKQIGYPEKERELLETAFEATHRKDSDRLSVNDVIDRYFAIEGEEMRMSESKAARLDMNHAAEIADSLASLDDFMRMFGKHPSKLPLTGIYPRVKTSRGQARIEAFLEEFPRFEKRVRRRERGLLNRWLFHHDAMHYLERIEQWNTFRRLVVLDDKLTANIDTISEAVSRWHANRHLFADWEPYAEAVVSLNRLGALGTLDYFLAGNSGKEAADAFLKGFYKARVANAIKKSGLLHELSSEKCEEAAEVCCNSAASGGIQCVDMRNVEMLTVGNACDSKNFDIQIIDGASRIPRKMVETLLSADAQTIFVDDNAMADRTSALAVGVDAGLPEYGLKFITRPRHERLVAFRNKTFYDGKLFTFPSADDCRMVVRHVDPSGCFDTETRTNETEAQVVVEIVEQYLSRSGEKPMTVGIVAFTQAQCELIDRLWQENPVSKQSKPVFVKTPETMTGAEVCDVLVLSVTYAPDGSGRVRAEFGCFEPRGGEQLLNRAISPVCREMTVVSSLCPSHIPEDEAMPYGVRVLRRMIAHATDPYCPLRGETAKTAASATVKSIASELKSRGFDVATNVGEGPFKIDIAVKDTAGADSYMFGVIVDGKNSEALPAETDRDVVVPGILSGLGWEIKRIRAVDWFTDRNGVLAKLLDGIG
ncbi:MAG: hypothetical protein K2J97_04395, partial [Muribaculaceae bacterium]|nr:hypothetical protein [Muribaculaceae bacterium]